MLSLHCFYCGKDITAKDVIWNGGHIVCVECNMSLVMQQLKNIVGA